MQQRDVFLSCKLYFIAENRTNEEQNKVGAVVSMFCCNAVIEIFKSKT